MFTDVEGSTRRWEADAQAMRAALVVHDKVLRTAIEAYDGFLFSHTGDGFVAAFASPMSAVNAAIDAQRELRLPVRMGLVTPRRRSSFSNPLRPPLPPDRRVVKPCRCQSGSRPGCRGRHRLSGKRRGRLGR